MLNYAFINRDAYVGTKDFLKFVKVYNYTVVYLLVSFLTLSKLLCKIVWGRNKVIGKFMGFF